MRSPVGAARGRCFGRDGVLNWGTLNEESIILHLESTTKEEAIRELIRKAPSLREVQDGEALIQSILSREKVMSTGLGRGVAISHGDTAELPYVAVGLGLSDNGIEYDSLDGKPVHILFIVVNSKDLRGEYLEVLSTLTSLMRSETVRETVRCCICARDVETALREAFDVAFGAGAAEEA